MVSISVVIPLYNGERFIIETLQSLLYQSQLPDSIIVVNDGSTDKGPEKVAEFGQNHPRLKIQIINQENRGLGAARNAAIPVNQCDYIAWCDADDLFHRDKIAAIHRHIRVESQSKWITHPAKDLQNGQLRSRFFRKPIGVEDLLINGNPFLPSACIFHRDLICRYPLSENRSMEGCEDLDLWLRLFSEGIFPTYINEPLTYYRIHPEAMSQQLEAHLIRTQKCLEKNNITGILYKETMARKYYENGRVLQRRGAHQKAANFYKKSGRSDLKLLLIRLSNWLKFKV
ncbi:MAG: glycosyltransferase family 2 protein [Cryomorphaceae bacterium]|nr:glycosyltransferase family 2 protein [Cryomorphaceae bacterium]